MKKLLLAAVVALCACAGTHDKPDVTNPTEADVAQYQGAADRLVSMLDGGWVVSRTVDGAPAHQGDALIWSGVAMGELDCARGKVIEDAMLAMVQETGGKLYRHPTLKGEVSADGAIGLYHGIASRIYNCHGSREAWTEALSAAPGFWENPLNVAAGVDLPLELKYVRDLLRSFLGLGEQPGADRQRELEREMATWVRLVKNGKKLYDAHLRKDAPGAFPANIGLLAFETVETLGQPVSREGRNDYCGATSGLDMPVEDAFCGRGDLAAWVRAFQYDVYEYRHQRAGAWEQPDGQGLHTPALDLIVGARRAFSLPR